MITFNNKKETPIVINFENENITVPGFQLYEYETDKQELEFTIRDEEVKKASFVGYLLLAVVGLIGMIFEIFQDGEFYEFKKRVSFPVKVDLKVTDNTVVEINNSQIVYHCCSVNSNAELETQIIIDNEDVKSQYKAFQKETLAVMFIPFAFILALCVLFIIRKTVAASLIAAAIIAVVVCVWYYYHKKNMKFIENLKRKI